MLKSPNDHPNVLYLLSFSMSMCLLNASDLISQQMTVTFGILAFWSMLQHVRLPYGFGGHHCFGCIR